MTLVISYSINYENGEGDLLEAVADINFPNAVESPDFPESACDETARRYLVNRILTEGGRVIKINKDGYRWKEYEDGD